MTSIAAKQDHDDYGEWRMLSLRLGPAVFALLALTSCDAISPKATSGGYTGPPPLVDASVTLGDQSVDLPFNLPDPAHVDLQTIAQQAQDIARTYEPTAWLSNAYSPRELIAGTVNLGLGGTITYRFAYKREDATAPPGRDIAEGHVVVAISAKSGDPKSNATAHVGDDKLPMVVGFGEDHPRGLPQCTVARAWAKAVETDVPADAVATVHYSISFNDRDRFMWGFSVAGHSELNREMDGDTCERIIQDNAAEVARGMARSRAETLKNLASSPNKTPPNQNKAAPKPVSPNAVLDPFN